MSFVCRLYLIVFTSFLLELRGYAQTTPAVKLPANWQQQGYVIQLKDELNHPDMNWPVTLLQYLLDFGAAGPAPDQFSVVDAQSGQPVPFQWANAQIKAGRVQTATLYLLTGLPSGGSKGFRLLPRAGAPAPVDHAVTCQPEKDRVVLGNGLVRVAIPLPAITIARPPVWQYGDGARWLGKGEWPSGLQKAGMKVQVLETGPLSTAYRITYTIAPSGSYSVTVRLNAAMEFATIEETMQGCSPADSLSWRIVWDGLPADTRYVPTRNGIAQKNKATDYYGSFLREPMEGYHDSLLSDKHPYQAIDQRNSHTGKLPFRLAVYDNWMSWWRLPTAAFWQEKEQATSIGLFVKEAEQWNDEQYPLWGSKEALSITFHWNKGVLDYTFPLVQGTRSTALAAYPHQKDRALMNNTKKPLAYIDYLRRYYGWVSLDKTKDWVLNYGAPDEPFQAYFQPDWAAGKLPLTWLQQSLHNMVASVANGSERNAGPTPVGARVFYESIAPAFALHKTAMTDTQYRQLRAWFLFMGYVCMDEGLMPMRTMLSGHPNFLMDIKSLPGLCAWLFPGHPQAEEMAAHFEKAIQLNYHYHIRPPVKSWEARGGRWTENLATYTWAALRPTLRTEFLLHQYYDGRNRILQPGISELGSWLLHALTPPLDLANGQRTFPPQGAHAQAFQEGPPDLLRFLGQQLMYYDPLLAEHILHVTRSTDKAFEGDRDKSGVWNEVLKGEWQANKGTTPQLSSAKFTGYGIVLRSAADKGNEMQVFLQQIDEGPNYRWGRAAQGGNGVLYYYAGGKRYSFNGPEDVGDGPFGDVERSANFGVRQAAGYRDMGPWRSIGRGDLTAPLYDFGFAQSATLQASDPAATYLARSITQAGADYIAVFDEVASDTITGRFAWFTGREDEFPFIHQVRPGVAFSEAAMTPSQSSYHKDGTPLPTKGRYYDGKGDFLTIVTHRAGLQVRPTAYGCTVQLPNGDKDHVFRTDQQVTCQEATVAFKGRSGYSRQYANGQWAAALFEGQLIQAGGLSITANENIPTGISFQTTKGGYQGKYQSKTAQTIRLRLDQSSDNTMIFYLDGIAIRPIAGTAGEIQVAFPAGHHDWQWTSRGLIPGQPAITGTVNSNSSTTVQWTAVPGATSYQVQISRDQEASWQPAGPEATATQLAIPSLTNGSKIHLRVLAKAAGGWGPASAAYPVYVTAQPPHYPEGLVIFKARKAWELSWGQLLGVDHYRLYRRVRGARDTSWQLIYKGPERRYTDRPADGHILEYAVAAVNGNGESRRSPACHTDPASLLNWFPASYDGFRRDTENHENGFPEFNPFLEDRKPVLRYPN